MKIENGLYCIYECDELGLKFNKVKCCGEDEKAELQTDGKYKCVEGGGTQECGLEGSKCGLGYPDCCEGLKCKKEHFWSLTGVCKKEEFELSWKLILIPILSLLGFFGLYAIKRDVIFGVFGAILGLLAGIVIYVMTWWKWLLLTLGGVGITILFIIIFATIGLPLIFSMLRRR